MPYSREHIKREAQDSIRVLSEHCYEVLCPLSYELYTSPEPLSFSERTQGQKTEVAPTEAWGKLWDCGWMHIKGVIPQSAKGKCVALCLDMGGEALLFDTEGRALTGFTTKASSFDQSLGAPGKWKYIITPEAHGGEIVDYWADIACNDLFGEFRHVAAISMCDLRAINQSLVTLWYDMSVMLDMYGALDAKSARADEVLFALRKASSMLLHYDEEEALRAHEYLCTVINRSPGDYPLSITAIGHAHLDLAWLWPIRETKRKAARTFSTALELMGRYPDYVFGQSQPQQYQWMKESYPELYARIRQAVAAGRLEPQGGMWVESDTNVPCGESLIRQFMYGKRFFSDEFGVQSHMLWLPDVFGYSAALPQILRKCGIEYFMTQKLSWNEHTKFPHQTFLWQGLDGSEVLAHMLPEETYNSALLPHSIRFAEENYHDKGVCGEALELYGIGDGGGGPGEEHVERLKRLRSTQGFAPVRAGKAEDFFARIDKARDSYPMYKGELYLQKHQGTYTTQARNKRCNRLMERALHDLDFLLCNSGLYAQYKPRMELIWKEMLLYQFHDILPGSSIDRVYAESLTRYEQLFEEVGAIRAEVLSSMSQGEGESVVNPSPVPQKGWVRMGAKLRCAEVGAYSSITYAETTGAVPGPLYATPSRLENSNLRVEVADDGLITSIFDKRAGIETLKAPSNELRLYADDGDCWDIPFMYRDKPYERPELTARRFYTEDDRAVIELDYSTGLSQINQRLILRADAVRLDISCEVSWHEEHRMLRVALFPDIDSDEAVCDIQYGNIRRSMLNNTAEDYAAFEICAHKFIEMREGGRGFALLNDCKYGHYAKRGELELDLLRAPTYPGRTADRADHSFTYSFYPHDLSESVYKEAYALNDPMFTVPYKVKVHAPQVEGAILDWVKAPEEGSGALLRIFEPEGRRCTAQISVPEGVTLYECDMLEGNPKKLETQGAKAVLQLHKYEVKTIKAVREQK